MEELLQREERCEPRQQPSGCGQRRKAAGHRGREHVEEGAAQQRPRRKGDQRHHDPIEHPRRKQERHAPDERDSAHQKTAADNPRERAQVAILPVFWP